VGSAWNVSGLLSSSDRHGGQYVLLKMHGDVGHPSSDARWTKTTTLAAERYELRVAALLALQMQAATLQDAAVKTLLDFAHHEARQAARLLGPLTKAGPMLGHRLIEHRLLGLATAVAVSSCDGHPCGVCELRHFRLESPWRNRRT